MIRPGQEILCSQREEEEEAEVEEEKEVIVVIHSHQYRKMCPIYFSGGKKKSYTTAHFVLLQLCMNTLCM